MRSRTKAHPSLPGSLHASHELSSCSPASPASEDVRVSVDRNDLSEISDFRPNRRYLFLKGCLKARYYVHHRAVPEHGTRRFLPLRMSLIQDRFIPVEALVLAALWARLAWFLCCKLAHCSRYKMVWVPKLSRSFVVYSRKRGSAWPTPVCWEYWFPHDQHA